MIDLNNTRSTEAEIHVIGAILLNPSIVSQLAPKINSDDFTMKVCADLYEAAVDTYERGKNFDGVVAVEIIRKHMSEEDASSFIREAAGITATDANALEWADIVHKYAGLRKIREAAQETILSGDDPKAIAGDLITLAHTFLQSDKPDRLKTLQDALLSMYHGKSKTTLRIDTGFPRLDGILKGLCGGQLILIGARPGVGKSAFMLDIARTAARKGHRAIIYSLEMLAEEIAERYVSRDERIDMNKLIDNSLNTEDWKAIGHICDDLSRLPILINDDPNITIQKIRAQVRAVTDVKLILVDYAQLMSSSKKYDNRNLEVGAISRDLKKLALELKIPVILLAQLNREKDETQEPDLRDLRDSGELEQNADKVIFLWNLEEPEKGKPTRVGVKVAKNRRGKRGFDVMIFNGDHMLFIETQEEYKRKKKSRVFKDDEEGDLP